MPRLYVKASHESSRTEVAVEQVEELPVKDLRAILAEKLDIPLEELCQSPPPPPPPPYSMSVVTV